LREDAPVFLAQLAKELSIGDRKQIFGQIGRSRHHGDF